MAETKVEFDFTEADDVLRQVLVKLGDLTPVNQSIGELLVESTKQRFVTGTDPDGNAWAPNAPSTLARKSGNSPLIDGGTLKEQIHYEARPDGVTWGSNLIQSAVMQMGAEKGVFGETENGSPIPWGTIPARPFIGLSTEDRQEIILDVEDHLNPD